MSALGRRVITLFGKSVMRERGWAGSNQGRAGAGRGAEWGDAKKVLFDGRAPDAGDRQATGKRHAAEWPPDGSMG